MTRYTNFALKRTYVEAGFNYRDGDDSADVIAPTPADAAQAPAASSNVSAQSASEPQSTKKRRKRTKSKKSVCLDGQETQPGVEGGDSSSHAVERSNEEASASAAEDETETRASKSMNSAKEKRKLKAKAKSQGARKLASERRRLKRQDERSADTICFACREKGHSARNCPKALASGDAGGGRKLGRQVVGICYRCGSKRHTLSRCKKPVDSKNPLPFSSCFVCSEKGHLASTCPQNKSKGIYPDGGACKLCGETTHLAKDCSLRQNDVSSKTLFVGTGTEAGADEDDFHIFKRKTAEVVREEKADDRRKKKVAVKVTAHSGIVKAFGQTTSNPKKVVNF